VCRPRCWPKARKAAESEGVALNQLITRALAEKVSAMRTEEYFEERARRADPARVNRILARVGKGNPPVEGDELPRRSGKRSKRRDHVSSTVGLKPTVGAAQYESTSISHFRLIMYQFHNYLL